MDIEELRQLGDHSRDARKRVRIAMSWIADLGHQELFAYDKEGRETHFFFVIQDHGFAEPIDLAVFVRINAEWPPLDGRWYEMALREMNVEQYSQPMMQTMNMDNRDLPEYRGKGISEALLPALSRLLQRDIISSPKYLDMGNRRSDPATAIWERLVASGLARQENDRYRLLYARAKDAPVRREGGVEA